MQQRDQRSPHPRKLRGVPRLLIDGLIRRLNRGVQSCLRFGILCTARLGSQMCKKRIRCKIACNLPCGRSAHAIADNVSARLRRSRAGVLVAMADTAAMGEHGVDKVVRRHSWSFSSPNKTIHVEAADTKGTLVLGVETHE